jgi:3-methylfumaryl-CoA hydratase
MIEEVRVVSVERVRDFQSFIDLDGPTIAEGDALPIGWHWIALARWGGSRGLGEDGHPARASGSEGSAYLRRMFAGGEISVHNEVRVGDRVTVRTITGESVRKSGSAGEFDLETERVQVLDDDSTVCIEERRDIVYLPRRPSGKDPSLGVQRTGRSGPLTRADGTWRLRTDPVLLMRFSALTANAHRIHYDAPFARHVEGYPGLVVHGPLMTMMLLEVLRREHSSDLTRVRHRNLAPLFCGQDAVIEIVPPTTSQGGRASLSAHGSVLVTVACDPTSTESSTP